jgi:tetratricopeptide (TPR) repeat protein
VAGQADAADFGRAQAEELVLLALSRPREALARARRVLAERPDPFQASAAHQAAGIVEREFGDAAASVPQFRRALRLARQAGSAERETDVLASLAVALIYTGRTSAGLATFDQALRRSSGALTARILQRRGLTLWGIGRYPEALADLREAVRVLRRAGDHIWTARALNARGLVYESTGHPKRADADFIAAGHLFAQAGQVLEEAYTVLNRALVAFGSGDFPAALSLLDEAAAQVRPLGVFAPGFVPDRCAVLLAAGLASDALAEAEAGAREFDHIRGQIPRRAELWLMAATCALAAGQPARALGSARAARRLFRAQQSAWWEARAGLVLIQARYASGTVSAGVQREAARLAAQLEKLDAADAVQAHLLAGRVASALGRPGDADLHLLAAAQRRWRGRALSRVAGWVAAALRAQAAGDSRAMFSACRRGLEVIEADHFTLGASELRAQATAHGAELAALAQREAARARRPRLLLAWSERWRATALAVPAVRPSADPELNASLAALREVTRGLEAAQREGRPTAAFQREQLRLENLVRAHARRARGEAPAGRTAVGVGELLQALGSLQLVQLVDVGGVIQVLVCGGGRVRQFTAGRAEEAARAGDFARFALRRLARNRTPGDADSALVALKANGPKLQEALLGPAARQLGDGPVVIVPPARFHTIPWALLPALFDRVVSVAPSATSWLRAQATPPPGRRHVTLARGPGLVTDGAEVPELARLYDDVTVLSGQHATAAQVLGALDGAWLAHIAAHGTFRADSPLFSSLRLHDGPMTVYDFEQLHRAPYRLVLSSCDSAVAAPAGADELLGLVSSLLPLGTAGIVAGVVVLNDYAVVPVMVDLHRHLRAGRTLAEALHQVRCAPAADQVQQATALSLVALGAG